MDFRVKLVEANGRIVDVDVIASDAASAAAAAVCPGRTLLSIRRQHRLVRSKLRSERFSLILFTKELLTLLQAGLSLTEALGALQAKDEQERSGVRSSLLRALAEGLPLSSALALFPQHFPQLFVASVRASERTGNLQEAFERYIEYGEQIEEFRKSVTSALVYPAVVALVGLSVIVFLLLYVLPRFNTIYASYSGELGWASSALLVLSAFLLEYRAALAVVSAALVSALIVILRNDENRRHWMAKIEEMPLLRSRLSLWEITQLYRALAMLLKAGIPILKALSMASGALGVSSKARLDIATRHVSEGTPVSEAFSQAKLVTPVAIRMLLVGERSGELGTMLDKAADFHEKDMELWLKRFTKLFEPLLMLFIGLVVGAIVVLMYMPVFELATALQ